MNDTRKKAVFSGNLRFILLLTLVIAIAYGIGLSRLSYYGDDWIYIYNYHIAGPDSFTLFTQWDRPYSAWIYVLTSAVFGESVLCYHFYVLFMRWLSALLFWSILKKTFGEGRVPQTAALLFATYPGFQQQPIAVEFLMHFTSLALILASLRLMQAACFLPRKKAILLTAAGVAAGGLGLFTCEYFIGLELARPFFLYFTIRSGNNENQQKDLKRMILQWLPYGLMTVLYFIWRIFIFSFATYGPKLINLLRENPVNGIKLVLTKIIQDIITVFFRAYRMIFSRPSRVSLTLTAAVLCLLILGVFIVLYHRTRQEVQDHRRSIRMLILGTAVLLLSGLPFWGTFLDVSTDFPWDRSTISFSPGVAIIIAVFLDLAFKPAFCCAAAAVITAFSALFHIQNTQVYIYEAEKMNDYFWQLAWRAPGLAEGTIVASENIPLDRTSDSDLSPVLNWQYAPDRKGLHYAYKYFDLDLREGVFYTDPATPAPVDHTYRTHMFRSSTDKTLGVFYRKNGCLQIIDTLNTGYPELPDSLHHIASLSDPDLIQTAPEAPAQPPKAIGKEPDHGYCYYFQKTTLAQQAGDPDAAYEQAAAILQQDLHPVYASDLAPVVLAYLQKSDYEGAQAILDSNQIGSEDWDYLCTYWEEHIPGDVIDSGLDEFYKSHRCL